MITFRLAAKTDVGLVRKNNEDNFQVARDLTEPTMRWMNNEVCPLGDKGALLVVADGMGGMNAGEVASALAIETIREQFAPTMLTPAVMKNRFSMEQHLKSAIIAADARIKAEARTHPETRGMGTTIVVAWLVGGKLYVSWCGDSRAYIYNPAAGLHQITKDHSYVQDLVDRGALSHDEAFDFPQSNIITRSLSDGGPKAKPETLLQPYDLCQDDIILLCTDGLCGMIRDAEMEAIIRNESQDMDKLATDLIRAACNAEGADNITLCLCQIVQSSQTCDPYAFTVADNSIRGISGSASSSTSASERGKGKKRLRLLLLLLFLLWGAGCYWLGTLHTPKEIVEQPTEQTEAEEQEDALPEEENSEGYTPTAPASPSHNLGDSVPHLGSIIGNSDSIFGRGRNKKGKGIFGKPNDSLPTMLPDQLTPIEEKTNPDSTNSDETKGSDSITSKKSTRLEVHTSLL